MTTVIKVENLSKAYRLGLIGGKTLREDLNRWWARVRRKPDPTLKIGQEDHGNIEGETIWALRDVSFEVQSGEVLGIIGSNGAGKSTLLKIISRITAPTSGQIKVKGRVGSLLEVGTGFHPELTGRENIYLNGAILGMKRAEIDRKFYEIVDFSGVEQFIDTPVKRYSSGMYVRLAFSVAAHLEPEILLVDEVLAVGDAEFQKKCLGKMEKVAGEGRTVLFVSHNMGSIADLCSRCLLINGGQIVEQGPSQEVINQYLSKDGSSQAWVDLTNWSEERSGDGPMRLEYLEIQGNDKKRRSQFAYGEPIYFKIGVLGAKDNVCIVGIAIRNSLGQRVLHLNNTDDSKRVVLPAERSEISVSLSRNILNDGTYHIAIWLGDGLNTLHDLAFNCLSFKVDSSSLGSVRSLGLVRLSAAWHIVERSRL